MKFDTQLIHGGNSIDTTTGGVSMPIHMASTFRQTNIGEAKYEYSRSGNPTREAVENLIAELEQGTAGFAFASGSAAISTIFSMFSMGDHIVIGNDIYGGTYRLIDQVLKKQGLTFTLVDTRDLSAIQTAIQNNTVAIYLETPTNPLLRISDISAIADLATQNSLLSIVDNTFASPYVQKPIELGVDIVVHSASKYLGGHSDLIAGLVVTRGRELTNKIKFLQNAIGAILAPQESWLLQRGIKTLGLRMQRQQDNTAAIFAYLAKQNKVGKIFYPGDPQSTDYELAKEQMTGFGAMISFELKPGLNPEQFIKHLNFITLAESLGAIESLIEIPALMTHGSIPREIRLAHGIQDELIRLSVGAEDIEDLIADLDQSFMQLSFG